MWMRRPRTVIALFTIATAACSAGSNGIGSGAGTNTGGETGSKGGGGAAGNGGNPASSGGSTGDFMGVGGQDMGCNGEGPDADGDGWTVEDGDCNDCDANVNPGAIEVIGAPPSSEGGGGTGGSGGGEYVPVDEDCDGTADNVAGPCDQGLALNASSPLDGARAIELCKQATNDKDWGIVSAQYVRANGTPVTANEQVGIFSTFGANVDPRAGSSMLSLSSGKARQPGQPGACVGHSCTVAGAGTPPPGFPAVVPNCDGDTDINDDIGLDLTIRAPTNATGYKFNFKFHSFEFGEYVCTLFNDQFIALVNPPPMGSQDGNISFDANGNPVSVNIAFFDVCASCADFAQWCSSGTCPTPPANCCSAGAAELAGTGFDNGFGDGEDAGGTSWLQTTAPVEGGSTFSIRFAIWDTGDTAYDSTVIIDDFEWIANGGTVTVGTTPAPPQ